MNEIIYPGARILYMKVGTHAGEGLADIIKRKSMEIEKTGFAMWGYGGNTCHPTSMVQPFARSFAERGKSIHLCMEQMASNHHAPPLCAAEYSIDGVNWKEIPGTIEVRGSRYALMIDHLREEEFALPLDMTRVPVGPSTGRLGNRYIKGQVDKACLEVLDAPELANEENTQSYERPINLVAELKAPYAVFLRNHR